MKREATPARESRARGRGWLGRLGRGDVAGRLLVVAGIRVPATALQLRAAIALSGQRPQQARRVLRMWQRWRMQALLFLGAQAVPGAWEVQEVQAQRAMLGPGRGRAQGLQRRGQGKGSKRVQSRWQAPGKGAYSGKEAATAPVTPLVTG